MLDNEQAAGLAGMARRVVSETAMPTPSAAVPGSPVAAAGTRRRLRRPRVVSDGDFSSHGSMEQLPDFAGSIVRAEDQMEQLVGRAANTIQKATQPMYDKVLGKPTESSKAASPGLLSANGRLAGFLTRFAPRILLRESSRLESQTNSRIVYLNHTLASSPRTGGPNSKDDSLVFNESVDPERIAQERRANQLFPTNFVSTAKYNWLNCIPKFLFEQFSRAANFYFLIIGIMYTIDEITPTPDASKYAGLISLIFVIAVSAIKEAVEDIRRHKEDRRVNRSSAYVVSENGHGAGSRSVTWGDVRVGDVVRIRDGEHFPADLVLLATSSDDGLAYVETKGLDGESNLKVKTSIPDVAALCGTEEAAASAVGCVECDIPNEFIYQFSGSIALNALGSDVIPLSHEQLLIRGSSLQNTNWIMGVVVYSGRDTKLMKNMKPRPKKLSRLERRLNYYIAVPIILQIILVITLTVFYVATCQRRFVDQDAWYLTSGHAGIDLCGFQETLRRVGNNILLMSTLMPIVLYVSIELVRAFQTYFVQADDHMYDSERDIRCEVRTSNVIDEPGVVTHIFSDKTGTLTANKMVFKKIAIVDSIYSTDPFLSGEKCLGDLKNSVKSYAEGHASNTKSTHGKTKILDGIDSPSDQLRPLEPAADETNSIETAMAIESFRLLALCHTVVPQEKTDDEGNSYIHYQAASPDEAALVEQARKMGYCFETRTSSDVLTRNPLGVEETWEVLGVLDFTSARKRMSVIVRSPEDGSIRLYCKGADTSVLPRSKPTHPKQIKDTINQLNSFAAEGLRTLCLAYRVIEPSFFKEWIQDFSKVRSQLYDKEEALDRVYEEIECDLTLLGCTAIEDRLQDGVPQTLQDIEKAGVKLWVLTGDKQETAINIGLSCGILTEDSDVVILNEETVEDCDAQIDKTIGTWVAQRTDDPAKSLALVVDGSTLALALHPELEPKFVLLGEMAKTVLACRVSPKQKTEIVELVRRHNHQSVTLAIGDGPNDVGMIQAAHVGIGIVGVEGVEAKLVSDISIGQFEYLRRLMFVHGRWCYKRTSKLILFILYKNITVAMLDFYSSFRTGFSGTPTVDPFVSGIFNLFLSPVPPIVFAVFETDLAASHALDFPEVYRMGQRLTAFSFRNFLTWIAVALWHSVMVFYIPSAANVAGPGGNGQVQGLHAASIVTFTSVVFIVHLQLAVHVNTWTWFSGALFFASMTAWLWVGPMYSQRTLSLALSPSMLNVIPRVFQQPKTWVVILLVATIAMSPTIGWKFYKKNYRPTLKTLARELMRKGVTRADVEGTKNIGRQPSLPTFRKGERVVHPSGFNFDIDDLGAVLRSQFRPDLRRVRMRFLKASGSDTELNVAGVTSAGAGADKRETHRRARSDGATLSHPGELLLQLEVDGSPPDSPSSGRPNSGLAPRAPSNIGGLVEQPAGRRRRPRPRTSVHFGDAEDWHPQ